MFFIVRAHLHNPFLASLALSLSHTNIHSCCQDACMPQVVSSSVFFLILSLFYLCSYLVVLLMCFFFFCSSLFFIWAAHIENAKDFYIYLSWMQLLSTNCNGMVWPLFCSFTVSIWTYNLHMYRHTNKQTKRDKAWAGNRVKIKRQTDKPRQAWIANSNWIIILNSLKCSQYTLSWYWCDRVAIVAMVCERKLWPSIDLQTHTKKGNKKSHTHRHKCTECIQGWTVHLSLQEINRTIGYRDLIARSLRSAWSKFIIFMH